MAKQNSAGKHQDPQPEVLKAIAELRKAHAVGLAILNQYGKQAEPGKHQIDAAAKEYGCNVDGLRKRRQFAIEFTKDDLEELCKLCDKHHRAFGLSLAAKLVTIKSKPARRRFQQDAIQGHWSHKRIVRELHDRLQHGDVESGRKPRGRKPQPQTISEALKEVKDAMRRFTRLLEHCAELAGQEEGKKEKKGK
jgi:hypothetical protein